MRYRNVSSGAVVSVRDDKEMDSQWEPIDGQKPKRSTRKADPEPADSGD